MELKKDLHIGQEGFPPYVVVGGDQQVYAIMKNLKAKNPDTFDWIYPVSGDWHFIKTVSEVLKSLLWDGGFHDIAVKCGLKKEVSKWQDTHRILVALLEGLLRTVLKHFYHTGQVAFPQVSQDWDMFETQMDRLCSGQNEVSQFWCKLIHFLMVYFAYYMAIRSGNWFLQNACIKQACDLLFAYPRDRYEVLAVQTLSDVLTYPTVIIQQFELGHWTASKLGEPFHNQALDEFHETSHFQIVELSDFLAYLENVVSSFCSSVGRTRTYQTVHDTLLPTIVTEVVQESLDLDVVDEVELHNVLLVIPSYLISQPEGTC